MRIHTDKLTEVHSAIRNTIFNVLPGVSAEIDWHKSRSRDGALELRLTGNGYASNFGEGQAATWDEWGVVFAAIFSVDPDATAGGTSKQPIYAGRDHYNLVTGHRFTPDGLPEDTHKRHKWIRNYAGTGCSKCSAENNWQNGQAHLDYWAGK